MKRYRIFLIPTLCFLCAIIAVGRALGIVAAFFPALWAFLASYVVVLFAHWIFDTIRLHREVRAIVHHNASIARGLCPTCGYDVRSNDERCSECGEAIPSKLSLTIKTPAIRTIIRGALAEAQKQKSEYIGSEHVLLALLNTKDTLASHILNNFDIGEEDVIAEIERLSSALKQSTMPMHAQSESELTEAGQDIRCQ